MSTPEGNPWASPKGSKMQQPKRTAWPLQSGIRGYNVSMFTDRLTPLRGHLLWSPASTRTVTILCINSLLSVDEVLGKVLRSDTTGASCKDLVCGPGYIRPNYFLELLHYSLGRRTLDPSCSLICFSRGQSVFAHASVIFRLESW